MRVTQFESGYCNRSRLSLQTQCIFAASKPWISLKRRILVVYIRVRRCLGVQSNKIREISSPAIQCSWCSTPNSSPRLPDGVEHGQSQSESGYRAVYIVFFFRCGRRPFTFAFGPQTTGYILLCRDFDTWRCRSIPKVPERYSAVMHESVDKLAWTTSPSLRVVDGLVRFESGYRISQVFLLLLQSLHFRCGAHGEGVYIGWSRF